MHATDDEIRDLLTTRMSSAPEPLSTDEIAARWRRAESRPVTPIRRRSPLVGLLAAAALLALLVAGLFVVSNRDPGSSQPPAIEPTPGARVGRYFLPETLPDGYRLLGVREEFRPASEPAQSIWQQSGTGRLLHLTSTGPEGRWSEWGDQAQFDGRTVRWSLPPSDGPRFLAAQFQVEQDGLLVDGMVREVDGEDAVLALASTVHPGDNGIPVVDDPAWTLVASSPAVTIPVAAQMIAYFGPPGGYLGAADIEVSVRRFTDPIVEPLELGVWTDTTDVGDRTVHLDMFGGSPRWFLAPDLEVQVRGSDVIDAIDVVGTIVEVDEAAFEAAIATIDESAAGLDVGESVTFPSGASVDMLGDRTSPRGACLTVGGTRRCDLALMATAGYTFDDTIASTNTDLLIDGHWFSVGLQVHTVGDFVPAPPCR